MSIDYLNAHCGLGSLPGPRPSQGRLCLPITVIDLTVHWAFERRCLRCLRCLKCRLLRVRDVKNLSLSNTSLSKWATFRTSFRTGALLCWGKRFWNECSSLEQYSSYLCARVVESSLQAQSRLTGYIFLSRPEIGRDYPLNLSISISGGKETNKDSLSNGE